ncbi:MAG: cobalt ECF transporter T component CbiQ [Verrucomicrobia bacterium]|nr:cobalt ECF transporter T component CbiQ [Verrucomicrobiota bacterium]
MFSLFSDFFACRDNRFSRIDPRVKLVVATTAIICVILSTSVALPVAVFLLSVVTTLALRIPVRLVALRLAAPLGIVAVLALLQSFTSGSTPLWSVPLGAWTLTATREGVHAAALTASRVCGAVSVVLLLSLVTPAHRIFHALRWFHVPQGWVEIAMLMYRYTFTLLDLTADLTAAQQLRMGYAGAGRALSSMGAVCGTVIIRSVDQAIRTHEAMVLRGYRQQIPFGPMPPLVAQDCCVTGLAVVALLLLYAAVGRAA